jgi:hypothetical protein
MARRDVATARVGALRMDIYLSFGKAASLKKLFGRPFRIHKPILNELSALGEQAKSVVF